jgi:hypothetical protein
MRRGTWTRLAVVALLAACAPAAAPESSPSPSLTAGWPTGPTSVPCTSARSVGWASYRNPGHEAGDAEREVSIRCDRDGVTLLDARVGPVPIPAYPAELSDFDRVWGAALPLVSWQDCISRDQARAGRHVPAASATVGMGAGGAYVSCAASGPQWQAVRAALDDLVARARARYPSPLPPCCNGKPPCQDDGGSCW